MTPVGNDVAMRSVPVSRPEEVMASVELNVLLVLDPATPTPIAAAAGWGQHRLTIDRRGLAALRPTDPAVARADAMIVEVDPENPTSLALLDRFVRDNADTPVIAAVLELTVAATRLALRTGAVDVLPLVFTAADLESAVVPAIRRGATTAVASSSPRGKIIAFVGALGGCGTTALAAQAGILLAASKRVCLIDLDVQFGNAALYLDLGTQLGVADVIDAGERLDVDLLRTIAQTHGSGLNVIASPPDILPLDTLSVENIDKMLALAAQAYDIVLVDLPGAWTAWSMRVVETADVTLMVTSLTVPGIHQARRQSEIIVANGFGDRLRVVVNRVTHPMFGKADLGETQSLLGRRIDYMIANDYPTVSTAIDRGKAFSAVKAKSRVEKDLRSMVTAIAEHLQSEVTL